MYLLHATTCIITIMPNINKIQNNLYSFSLLLFEKYKFMIIIVKKKKNKLYKSDKKYKVILIEMT